MDGSLVPDGLPDLRPARPADRRTWSAAGSTGCCDLRSSLGTVIKRWVTQTIRRPARGATWRIITTSTAGSTRLFLDRDRQYSCAYFRARRRDAGGGAARQEAAHRSQAEARPAGSHRARHRLRLGRHGADARDASSAPACTASPSPPSSSPRREARAAAAGLSDRVTFSLTDYRARRRAVRPHRLGRHVRACRRRSTTGPFFDMVKRSLAPDGVALLHAIGRMRRAGLHQSVAQQIHLPGRLFAGAERGAARISSAPGSGPPISRSCGCITR